MKKSILTFGLTLLFMASCLPVYASDMATYDSSQIVSINTNLVIPNNVTVTGSLLSTDSVTFEHSATQYYNSPARTKSVYGMTQAKQGGRNVDSYTRARYEYLITVYGDSGRVWSTNGGPSSAQSDWVYDDPYIYLIAHTYYGNE